MSKTYTLKLDEQEKNAVQQALANRANMLADDIQNRRKLAADVRDLTTSLDAVSHLWAVVNETLPDTPTQAPTQPLMAPLQMIDGPYWNLHVDHIRHKTDDEVQEHVTFTVKDELDRICYQREEFSHSSTGAHHVIRQMAYIDFDMAQKFDDACSRLLEECLDWAFQEYGDNFGVMIGFGL